MKLPLLELQKAVFAKLNKNISCEVYDNINYDENGNPVVQFPFVRLGSITLIDNGTKTDYISNCTYTINVFSQNSSQKEVKKILNEVVEQLTLSPLVIDGFIVNVNEIDSVQIIEQEDNNVNNSKGIIIYNGIIVLRYIMREE
jgi:hypothetical protein